MSKSKLKIAFYWAASCGGCEIAVLDINEKILGDELVNRIITFGEIMLRLKSPGFDRLFQSPQGARNNASQWD